MLGSPWGGGGLCLPPRLRGACGRGAGALGARMKPFCGCPAWQVSLGPCAGCPPLAPCPAFHCPSSSLAHMHPGFVGSGQPPIHSPAVSGVRASSGPCRSVPSHTPGFCVREQCLTPGAPAESGAQHPGRRVPPPRLPALRYRMARTRRGRPTPWTAALALAGSPSGCCCRSSAWWTWWM